MPWKTKFDRCLPIIKDWIPKLLHHHHRDISSEWVDLTYDTKDVH